jgi:HEAT repeat protein
MDPPEAVFGIHHSILRKHARPADVIKLLRESPDPQVRRAVCYHIRQTSLKSGRDAVLAALFDPSPDVRLSAADAYGRVGRSEDFLILKAAYKLDRRPRFRRRIVFALGEVQCQAAAPFLIELLMLGQCRLDVIESLGELRGPEVRAELAAALEKESDSGWRRAIEDAIELIDARARRVKFEAIGHSKFAPLSSDQRTSRGAPKSPQNRQTLERPEYRR